MVFDTMPDLPADPPDTLKARAQEAMARAQKMLIEYLHSDLELAFTILGTAKIEAGSDADLCKAATGGIGVNYADLIRPPERLFSLPRL